MIVEQVAQRLLLHRPMFVEHNFLNFHFQLIDGRRKSIAVDEFVSFLIANGEKSFFITANCTQEQTRETSKQKVFLLDDLDKSTG